jgi:MFS family permease
MERPLRLLAVGTAVRTFGSALYFPFLALFLENVLGVSYLEIGGLFVVVGLTQLPFNFLGGLLTDRIGRRRLILLGLASEAAATGGLAYGFWVQSLTFAVLAATLGGLATAAAGPAASAYIADYALGAERTRGFTWYRIGFNAGYSAGVTLGGLLAAAVGFAAAVAVAAVVIGGAALALTVLLGPSPFDERLGQRPAARPGAGPSGGPAPHPSVRDSLRILARDRPALEALVAMALASLVAGQWTVTFPLYVHDVLGVSYSLLGVGLALNGLVVVFGQRSTTERVIGQRHTSIAVFGVAFYVAAFVGLGLAGWAGFYPLAAFFAAVVVLTIGENLLTIPQATLPSNLAPAEEIGAYNGAFAVVAALGYILSVPLGGAALTWTTNPLLIWALLCVPAVAAIALFRDAARRIPLTMDRA